MNVKIEKSWKKKLSDFFKTEIFENLTSFIKKEYEEKNIYPNPKNIFKTFELTPFEKVKVVILDHLSRFNFAA